MKIRQLYAQLTFPKIKFMFLQNSINTGRIKYEIRSKVKGKLVPIYLNYQDTNSHFRIKTDFLVKHEYWNASKELIKAIYFDKNNFSIEQRNSEILLYWHASLINELTTETSRVDKLLVGQYKNSNPGVPDKSSAVS